MTYTVPVLSIIFILLAMLSGIAIPILLFIYFKKKGCKAVPFWIGCAVMFIFAFLLEQIAHTVILGSGIGATIKGNILLYAVYGGFMAGLFEESGRFLAFKTVLKKYQENDRNALMYGAGHGGFEAFYLLGIGMINNLIYAILMNAGQTGVLTAGLSGSALTAVQSAFRTLSETSPFLFLLGILERFAAVAAQLSFSVLVWFAAKKGGRHTLLFPLAILMHLILDAGAVLLNHYISGALLVTELVICAISALFALFAFKVYRRNSVPDLNHGEGSAIPE